MPSGKRDPDAGAQATGTVRSFQSSAVAANATATPARLSGSAVTEPGTVSLGGAGGLPNAGVAPHSPAKTSPAPVTTPIRIRERINATELERPHVERSRQRMCSRPARASRVARSIKGYVEILD